MFNAVSNSAKAQANNYRFCTIEPNTGLVNVPDPRLNKLAELVKRTHRLQIEIVDLASVLALAGAPVRGLAMSTISIWVGTMRSGHSSASLLGGVRVRSTSPVLGSMVQTVVACALALLLTALNKVDFHTLKQSHDSCF